MSGKVAIVGAGIVGAACARALARDGFEVVVLDDRPIGSGATAAGMGHVVAMDDSEAQFALCRYSQTLWDELAPELPKGVEHTRCGTIWVASDDEEMAEVGKKARFYADRGVEAEAGDGPALARLEPNLRPGLPGGLRVPGDSVVYPPCAAAYLIEQARKLGAEVRLDATVAEIGGGWVRLGNGARVEADYVVKAAGAGAARLTPGLAIRPRKGHLVITDRHPGFVTHQLLELGYLKSAHGSDASSVAFNVQPRATGQLLIGSSRQYDVEDPAVEPTMVRRMIDRALLYMPGLARLSAIRAWTGFRAATPDSLPIIGPHPDDPRLILATGHEGLGITTSLGTAELVADHLAGRGADDSGLAVLAFAVPGGRAGRPLSRDGSAGRALPYGKTDVLTRRRSHLPDDRRPIAPRPGGDLGGGGGDDGPGSRVPPVDDGPPPRAVVRDGDLLRVPPDHRRPTAMDELPGPLPAGDGGPDRWVRSPADDRSTSSSSAPGRAGGDRGRLGGWPSGRPGRRQPRPRRPDLARRAAQAEHPRSRRAVPDGPRGRVRGPDRDTGRRHGGAESPPRRIGGRTVELGYRALVLATGARELFLPFPGWTLPNVLGAGGLQALVKSGLPIEGKSVVVAGSGPLLLAVAALLKKKGAVLRCIAEQAPMTRLVRFGLGLWSEPGKLFQAVGLRAAIGAVRYRAGCWPIEALGDEAVRSVRLTDGRSTWSVECDYLACGFGLVPNLELPAFLGCSIEAERPPASTNGSGRPCRRSTARGSRPGSAASKRPCSKDRSPGSPRPGRATRPAPCSGGGTRPGPSRGRWNDHSPSATSCGT